MRNLFFLVLLAIPFVNSGCSEMNKESKIVDQSITEKESGLTFPLADKEVTIYTTAKDTELRLSNTGNVDFKSAGQPLETEIAIFVNPNHTFQHSLVLEVQ